MDMLRENWYSDTRKRYAAIPGFRDIDFQFADFIQKRSTSDKETLYQAALLLSYATGLQHSALNLKTSASEPIESILELETDLEKPTGITLPDYDDWCHALRDKNPEIVGAPGEQKPLILDDELLYLNRYWDYEHHVAENIVQRCTDSDAVELPQDLLQDLFPSSQPGINLQGVGAVAAFKSRFCVISGGPGTGKTTTVARLLALLLQARRDLRIHMVAPTGKAADRLVKSVQNARATLPVSDELKQLIPEKASTIHRYLAYLPSNNTFRHNARRQTTSDLLIVDEASMVSLPLFAHLFAAIRDDCRVILLGDKDQLASVENGCIFGDLSSAEHVNTFSDNFASAFNALHTSDDNIDPSTTNTVLTNRVIKLEHSYRFGNTSGIGYLSHLVNEARTMDDANDIQTFLQERKLPDSARSRIVDANKPAPSSDEFTDISWQQLPAPNDLKHYLQENATGEYSDYLNAVKRVATGEASPDDVLSTLDRFRILCAVNRGIYGVENLNSLMESILFGHVNDLFYPGRPIMVLTNDHSQHLYNGDVGIILKDKNGDIRACFRGENDTIRSFAPAYLPSHITAFAMTIHKSQGSEFDNVLMILPGNDSRILTKEIIYTGITRAKSRVELWCKPHILKSSVIRTLHRTSGLKKRLTDVTK